MRIPHTNSTQFMRLGTRHASLITWLLVFAFPSWSGEGDFYRMGASDRELGEQKKVSYLITVDPTTGGDPIAPPSWATQNANNERMDANLRRDSYGQAWLSWNIYPAQGETPLVISDEGRLPLDHNDQHNLTWAASRAAKTRWGSDIESGMRLRYGVFSTGPDGSAYVGGTQAAGTWDPDDQYHEITHNFGHHHGSDQTTPVGGGRGGYSSPMRALNGWLREGEGFHLVSQSGIYRIYELDVPALMPGRQLSAVVVRKNNGIPQDVDLWIEYRPQLAETQFRDQDGSKGVFPEFAQGVRLVNYRARYSNNVDIDPADGRRFSMLLPGESWTDDTNLKASGTSYVPTGFTITTLRVNDTIPASIDVRIDMPGSTDYLPQAGADVPRLMATGIAETFDGTLSLDYSGSIVSYSWDFGDGNSSTAPSPSHSYASAGTYTWTLTVTDNDGNTSTEYGDVEVSPATPPAFTLQPQNVTKIEGNSVTFEVDYTGAPIPTLQWYKDGNLLPGETGKTLERFSITMADAGEYSAVIQNAVATVPSTVATLTVIANSPPVARFTPLASGNVAPMNLTLNAGASSDADGNSLTYFWDIGDGNGFVQGVMTQAVTLNEAGLHLIRLKVNDGLVDSPVEEQEIWVSEVFPGSAVSQVGPAHVEKGKLHSGYSYVRTLSASENTVLLLGACHTWGSDEVTGVTVDGAPMTLLARQKSSNPGAVTLWGIELGTVTEGQQVTIQITALFGSSPFTALSSVQVANAGLTGAFAQSNRAHARGPVSVNFDGGLVPGSYLFTLASFNRDASTQSLTGIPTLASGAVDSNKLNYAVGGEQVSGTTPVNYSLSFSVTGGNAKGIAIAAVALAPRVPSKSVEFNNWLATQYPLATGNELNPEYIPHSENGLKNVEYFAFGIDNPSPSVPNPLAGNVVESFGKRLELRFPRHSGRGDVRYRVYACSDLTTPETRTLIARSHGGQPMENVNSQSFSVNEEGSGDLKTVTVRDLTTTVESEKRFLILEVEIP